MTAKEVQLRVGLLENEICIYYIMKKDTKASTQELVKKEILALFSRNELVYGQTKGPTSEQTSGFKPALNVSPQSNPGSSFDTFSHFNSKLLGATTVMPTDPASNSRQQSFGFFSEQSVPNNQSSNIRQLFDNGANSPPALRKSTVSLMSARNSTISGSNNNQSSSATSMQQSNNPPSLVKIV